MIQGSLRLFLGYRKKEGSYAFESKAYQVNNNGNLTMGGAENLLSNKGIHKGSQVSIKMIELNDSLIDTHKDRLLSLIVLSKAASLRFNLLIKAKRLYLDFLCISPNILVQEPSNLDLQFLRLHSFLLKIFAYSPP